MVKINGKDIIDELDAIEIPENIIQKLNKFAQIQDQKIVLSLAGGGAKGVVGNFALVYLLDKKDAYASMLAKEVDVTYSHCVKTLQQLEEGGLVIRERIGRESRIKLTDKGKEIAMLCAKIRQELIQQ